MFVKFRKWRYSSAEDLQQALESVYKHMALALAYSFEQALELVWYYLNLTVAQPWIHLVRVGDSIA